MADGLQQAPSGRRVAVTARPNITLDYAVAETEAAYVAANPQSARYATKGEPWMPGGNTRTTIHYDPFPLTIVGGKEGWLFDADGHRYADFVNEYSAALFGHDHPVVREAVADALRSGINLGGPGVNEHRLAAHIVGRFPSIELVRFCNSGTEANLLALGAARAFTGRRRVLAFTGAYHGSLLYFHHGASPINAVSDVVLARYNDWDATQAIIEANRDRLAAVILEPMQGAGGCIPATREFLGRLREMCSKLGIILVFDEVMTSRLSPGGLQSLVGITPDLTTLGKYIGGGMTLAAFGGRADIMGRFDPRAPHAFPHGGTFNNNAVAMAAGVRVFDEVLTSEALGRMNGIGDALRQRLNCFAGDNGLPFRATGMGSLVGLHFHRGSITCSEDLEPSEAAARTSAKLKKLLHLDLIAAGFYITRRGYLALSLRTTEGQAEGLASEVEEWLTVRRVLLEPLLA